MEKPDYIEPHRVVQCAHCQADLSGVAASKVEKRQVFDLPPIRLEVSEHQGEVKTCPQCGAVNTAAFPKVVTQPTQYGPRVRACMVYLNIGHFIPLERAAEILSELCGQNISDGTVYAAAADMAEIVAPVNEQVKTYLIETEEPVDFDETGVASVIGTIARIPRTNTCASSISTMRRGTWPESLLVSQTYHEEYESGDSPLDYFRQRNHST